MIKTKKTKTILALGPVSTEIIEAVFRYSDANATELMLIASKNQIDYDSGYVNGWSTKSYMDYVVQMQAKYPQSRVLICRDHCGPGFNGRFDIQDTYATIQCDIENGFDLIHIDFCHYPGDEAQKHKAAQSAVLFCQKLNPAVKLEIGTDENTGALYTHKDAQKLIQEVEFFQYFCAPEFFVIQTGSLIKECQQVGTFNREFIAEMHKVLADKNIKLKEHNADYLSQVEIRERNNIVDAMNVAPQLGVVQTSTLIQQCLSYGIDLSEFAQFVYSQKKWEKWMIKKNHTSLMGALLIAGHYHFYSDLYAKIVDRLRTYINPEEIFVNSIMNVIKHYEDAFEEKEI